MGKKGRTVINKRSINYETIKRSRKIVDIEYGLIEAIAKRIRSLDLIGDDYIMHSSIAIYLKRRDDIRINGECGLHNKVFGHEDHNCCDCKASVWRDTKICKRKDCHNGLVCEFESYEK